MRGENSVPQLVFELSDLVAKAIAAAKHEAGADLSKLTKMMSELVQMKIKAEALVLGKLDELSNLDRVELICAEFIPTLKEDELREFHRRVKGCLPKKPRKKKTK